MKTKLEFSQYWEWQYALKMRLKYPQHPALERIARDINLEAAIQAQMAKCPKTRVFLATNPALLPSLQAKLARLTGKGIKVALFLNPAVSPSIKTQLIKAKAVRTMLAARNVVSP